MDKRLNTLLVLFFLSFSGVYAAEQRFQDMIASVVVGSTFGLSLDRSSLDFGLVKPGIRIELYPESYYHQITCISNNKKIWYLKVSMPTGITGQGSSILPKDSLKWQIFGTNGSGAKKEGWESLQDNATVVYASGSTDSQGEEVYIRFRYVLDVPSNVASGNYNAVLVYTMTEIP
jgi:hypothetical protein